MEFDPDDLFGDLQAQAAPEAAPPPPPAPPASSYNPDDLFSGMEAPKPGMLSADQPNDPQAGTKGFAVDPDPGFEERNAPLPEGVSALAWAMNRNKPPEPPPTPEDTSAAIYGKRNVSIRKPRIADKETPGGFPVDRGPFLNAFARGGGKTNLEGLAYTARALSDSVGGNETLDAVYNSIMDRADELGERIKDDNIGGFTDEAMKAWKAGDVSGLWKWAQSAAGEGIGSSAGTIAGALGGGAVGGGPGAFIGGVAGAQSQSIGQMNQALEEEGLYDRALRGKLSLVGGQALAFFDSAFPEKIASRVLGHEAKRQFARGIARRLIEGGMKGAAWEGMTEALQDTTSTLISKAATGHDVNWYDLGKQAVDSAAGGALPGAVIGGGVEAATPDRTEVLDATGQPMAPGAPQPPTGPQNPLTGIEFPNTGQREGSVNVTLPHNTDADRSVVMQMGVPDEAIDGMSPEELFDTAQRGLESGLKPIPAPPPGPAAPITVEPRTPPDLREAPIAPPEAPIAPPPPPTGTRMAPAKTDDELVAGRDIVQEPTPGQAEAGNYQKLHYKGIPGLPVTIETPAGHMRRSKPGDPNGPWESEAPVDYGYVKRSKGADDEHVDIMLGAGDRFFIQNQHDPDSGEFDEHKIVRAPDMETAKTIYDSFYSDGRAPERRGALTEVSLPDLKDWLSGDTKEPVFHADQLFEDMNPNDYVEPTPAPSVASDQDLSNIFDEELQRDVNAEAAPELTSRETPTVSEEPQATAPPTWKEYLAGKEPIDPEKIAKRLGVTVKEANDLIAQTLAGRASPLRQVGVYAKDPKTKRRSLVGSKVTRKPVLKGPRSLLRFLMEEGGLADHPELRRMDAHKHSIPGLGSLVRVNGGLSLEDAMQRAMDAGYIQDREKPGQPPVMTPDEDLMPLIREELAGKKQLTEEGATVQAEKSAEEGNAEVEHNLQEALTRFGLKESDWSPEQMDRARAEIAGGRDPDSALEELATEGVTSLIEDDQELMDEYEAIYGEPTGPRDEIPLNTAPRDGEEAPEGAEAPQEPVGQGEAPERGQAAEGGSEGGEAEGSIVNGKPPNTTASKRERLILLACSQQKSDEPGPLKAIDRYTGVQYQTLKSHAPSIEDQATLWILSAKHGWVAPYQRIDQYEQAMTARRADELIGELTEHKPATPLGKGHIHPLRTDTPYKDIMIVGGAEYRRVMEEALRAMQAAGQIHPDASINATQGAIGVQRQQFGQYLDAIQTSAETSRKPTGKTTEEAGAEGKPQTVLPGAEKAPDAKLAQIKADAPLKPTAPQNLSMEEGLFGEGKLPPDLFADSPKTPVPSTFDRGMVEEPKPAASNDELSDIFDQELVKSPEPKSGESTITPSVTTPRTTPQVAKSAATNVVKGIDEAFDAASKLFGASPKRLGSSPGFDPDTYEQAKPIFRAAVAHFKEAASDIRELLRRMVQYFKAKGMPIAQLEAMKPYVIQYIRDVESGKEDISALGSGQDLERDRGDTEAQDEVGEPSVPPAPGGNEPGARQGTDKARAPRGRPGRNRVPSRNALAVGGGRDRTVPDDTPGPERSPNPTEQPGGSSEDSEARPSADGSPEPEALPDTTAPPGVAERRELQKAPKTGSVSETLPMLTGEQQDDVRRIEERFEKGAQPGMLITNGTGTGKTFTGLGAIKRMVNKGQKRVLVITPSQPINRDWVKAATNLDMDFNILNGIEDKGGPEQSVTTFANLGANRTLADGDWDLIVVDESHNLTQGEKATPTAALGALRALSLHPDGLRERARMVYRKEWEAVEAESNQPRGAQDPVKLRKAWDAFNAKATPAIEAWEKLPRPKVLFQSATPFAYHFSLDYAEGYLFDFPKADESGAYNAPSGRDSFYMQNFGYRKRYGKLTKPEADVRSEVMEREYHERLRREGSLWGRVLEDVDHDYDRKFVLVENALGKRIDELLEFLRDAEDGRFQPIHDLVFKKFDFLSRQRLLEAIKAQEVIKLIPRQRALGRKVVIFHDFNEGAGFNPFELEIDPEQEVTTSKYVNGKVETYTYKPAELYQEFLDKNQDARVLQFKDFPNPIQAITKAFPEAMVYNGTVSNNAKMQAKKDFNDDAKPEKDIIIIQAAAGEAGISLHDTTGKNQRVEYNLGMPSRPTRAIQQEGRIRRLGQKSNAMFRYLNTGTAWERSAFAQKIAERAGTAENLAMGNQARALRQSFIDGFTEADDFPPGHDGEGTGGKTRDAAVHQGISEFDRAITHYHAQQKGRKNNLGVDYFATPEPLGYKMVQWAGVRPGEKILEPSAGHGAIARYFPEDTTRHLVEPSANLGTRAALVSPGSKLIQDKFENHNIVNKYHAIVMNPPFGTGGKTAMEHMVKAMKHLAEGGRLVAIYPMGPASEKRLQAFLDAEEVEVGTKGVHLIQTINLPAVTFERAGTSVRAQVLIWEKNGDPKKLSVQSTGHVELGNYEKIADFFEGLRDVDMPPRTHLVELVDPAADTTLTIDGVEWKLKTQADWFIARPIDQLGPARFTATKAAAKARNGNYVKNSGFEFPTPEDRQAFIDEIKAPKPITPAPGQAHRPGETFNWKLGQTKHTKTGKDLYVATFPVSVADHIFKATKAKAVANGGWYSSWRGPGAIPGFQFSSEGQRQKFIEDTGDWTGSSPTPAARQEDTPAFKKWFSGSKVTTPDGRPRRMFHGSIRWDKEGGKSLGDFDVFNRRASVEIVGREASFDTVGSWFSDNPDQKEGSGMYAGSDGIMYPVYLAISNPKVTSFQDMLDQIWELGGKPHHKHNPKQRISNEKGVEAYRAWLKKNGYDGIHIVDTKEREFKHQDVWIALEPTQIKSATGNRGTFDPNDPSIIAQAAPVTAGEPVFFSALTKAAGELKQEKAPPGQWANMLRNMQGVKPEELAWSGVMDWLAEQGKTVTRQELVNFLRANEITVVTKQLGDDIDPDALRQRADEIYDEAVREQIDEIQEDFEESYGGIYSYSAEADEEHPGRWNVMWEFNGETGIDSTEKDQATAEKVAERRTNQAQEAYHIDLRRAAEEYVSRQQAEEDAQHELGEGTSPKWEDVTYRGGRNYTEHVLQIEQHGHKADPKTWSDFSPESFEDPHFQGVGGTHVAHVRSDERMDNQGNRVLFLQEMQSGLHQAGARKGYAKTKDELKGVRKRAEDARHLYADTKFLVRETLERRMPNTVRAPAWQIAEAIGSRGRQDAFAIHGVKEEWFTKAETKDMDELHRIHPLLIAEIEKADVVPDAPFKGTAWLELAFKRMLRYAADNGYHSIVWPSTPEMVRAIEGWPQFRINEHAEKGTQYFIKRGGEPDLNVTGIINRYLKDLPRFADKYVRRMGGKVESIPIDAQAQWTWRAKNKPGTVSSLQYEVLRDGLVVETFENVKEAQVYVDDRNEDPWDATTMGVRINDRMKGPQTLFRQGSGKPGDPRFFTLQELVDKVADLQARIFGDKAGPNVATQLHVTLKQNDQGVVLLGGLQSLIKIASHGRSVASMLDTYRHEAFHVVRELGLITPKEWAKLKRRALNEWMDRYDIRERYEERYRELMPHLSEAELEDFMAEEAVAEAMADRSVWRKGDLLTQIAEFFEALGNWLRGRGFESTAQVLRAFDAGRAAQREITIGTRGYGLRAAAQAQLAKQPVGPRRASTFVEPTKTPTYRASLTVAQRELMDRSRRWTQRLARSLNAVYDPIRQEIQDRAIRLTRTQQAIREQGGVIPDYQDTDVAYSLYKGRVADKMERFQDETLKPLIDRINALNISLEDLDLYLYARHAPERNAWIAQINPKFPDGGSGMTDADAAAVMAGFGANHRAMLDQAAQLVDRLNHQTRVLQRRAGLISQDTFDNWENDYDYYVPLRGWEDIFMDPHRDHPDMPNIGNRFSIRGKEAQAALGRTTTADSPLTYSIYQAQQAIVRAEKNRVAQSLLTLVQNHPNENLWKVNKADIVRKRDPQTGQVVEHWVQDRASDNLIGVKQGGVQYLITIHDTDLARALRDLDGDKVGFFVRNVLKFQRLLAGLITAYSPEFVLTNFARDLQTAGLQMNDSIASTFKLQVFKDVRKAMWGIYKAIGDPSSNSPWAVHYREFKAAGAQTGWLDFKSIEQEKKRVDALMQRLNPTMLTRVRMTGEVVFGYIERLNTMAENAIRLSVYVNAKRNGFSTDQSARAAREVTVDFNRMGHKGPWLNAWFMFFGAGMQGITRTTTGLVRSKKVRQMALLLVGIGIVNDIVNKMMGGDDDDDEDYWDKLLKTRNWEVERNMVILTPSKMGDYVKIPASYGFNIFPYMGVQISAAMRGAIDPETAAKNIVLSVLHAWDPVGGGSSSFASWISPTLSDPFIEIATNTDWSGRPIYPERRQWEAGKPNSQLAYRSVGGNFKWAAEELNELSGGNVGRAGRIDISPEWIEHIVDSIIGSAGQTVTKTVDVAKKLMKGEPVEPYQIPFVRKFWGQVHSDIADTDAFYKLSYAIDAAHNEQKALKAAGDSEGLAAAREKYSVEIGMYGMLQQKENQLRQLRKQRNAMEERKDMTAAQKQEAIAAKNERIQAVMASVRRTYNARLRAKAEGSIEQPVVPPRPPVPLSSIDFPRLGGSE